MCDRWCVGGRGLSELEWFGCAGEQCVCVWYMGLGWAGVGVLECSGLGGGMKFARQISPLLN